MKTFVDIQKPVLGSVVYEIGGTSELGWNRTMIVNLQAVC